MPWYERLFGASPVVWAVGQTLVGPHEHSGKPSSEPFSERRPGLDHVAFGCANVDELEGWRARPEELGVDHGGIVTASYGSGLCFRDPDNIALEFFAAPG